MMLRTIKGELDNFNNKSIEIVEGFDFNQKETLKKIYLYYNSKYESGEIDDQGDKKYFFNINRNPCDVGTKAVDFDTKNINVQTAAGGSPLKTWFFERDLKFWMKDKNFGRVLNRIFKELPIFGSVVLKIIDGEPYFVDLRNFVVEQSADSLDKSNYIIEVHNYTPVEFKKMAKEKKWDNTDEVLKQFRASEDSQYIKIFERYGEIAGENGDFEYKRILIADTKSEDENEAPENPEGIILQEKKIEKHPYVEFHWEKIPGRWLGIGRVEILSDPQIRVNEISNQQVKSSYYSTLRLWQTRDDGVNRNLLTDVENGEVLNVDSEVTQVDMADRNLAYYANEIARWVSNRDELTFSYDVTRGEALPSGTPLGSMRLAAGMAGSYFDQIRENIALDIKKMLYDIIIPHFEEQSSEEHTLRIAGEDLDKVNDLIIETKTRKRMVRFLKEKKRIPSRKEFEIFKGIIANKIKEGKEKIVKIPKNYYKGLKYKIDIDIVGEAMDTRIKSANLMAALQAITSDPTLLTDPTKKKFFYKFLEQGGISAIDFEAAQQEKPSIEEMVGQTVKGSGGGVSKPTMSTTPMSGTSQSTI